MSKRKPTAPVRLNLGCGRVPAGDGFINVDNFLPLDGSKHNFVHGDILDLPFERDFADYILCDNVLEHLAMSDVPRALHEIRRVLKVGGRAVLIVPDFSCIAKQWLAADEGDVFNPYVYRYVSETIYGNQLHAGEFHRAAFSPKFFNYVLQMCGFTAYTLTMYPAGGLCPDYPGMQPLGEGARCRNDQIVADVKKGFK